MILIAYLNENFMDCNENLAWGKEDPQSIPCRIMGFTAFNSLLQYVKWLVWEVCSVNWMLQNKEAWLQGSKLAKMLCTGQREFGANRWRFLSKANTLYFWLCKTCEFMMCCLIVNHQFYRMHPWCSWECMLPGGSVLAKGVTPFGIGISCCYPYFWGKVRCVSEPTLCELYGVKVWEGWAWNAWSCRSSPKRWACASFLVFLPGCTLYCIVYSGGFFRTWNVCDTYI